MTLENFIRTWCAEQGFTVSDPTGFLSDLYMGLDVEPNRFKVRRYGKVVHFCRDGRRFMRGCILPKVGAVGPFCMLYH